MPDGEPARREPPPLRIRDGGESDLTAVLAMLDDAVAWLHRNGRSGQWGSQAWSAVPKRVDAIADKVRTGTLWIAEIDGQAAGAMTVSHLAPAYVPVVDEPESYVTLLVTARTFAGRGVGAALLAHARDEARRQGVGLVRVDCYAGGDGRLVDYYRRNGFTPAQTFRVGDWPGRVLVHDLRCPA